MKNCKVSKIIIAVVMIMSVILLIFKYSQNTGSIYKSILKIILIVLAIMLAVFATTIMHELGHLIFGVLCGHKLVSITFFNIRFEIEQKNIKFRYLKNTHILGQCNLVPYKKYNKNRAILYYAGGVVVNILNIIWGSIYINNVKNIYIEMFLTLFIIINAMFVIGNSVPEKSGCFISDGSMIRSLFTEKYISNVYIIQYFKDYNVKFNDITFISNFDFNTKNVKPVELLILLTDYMKDVYSKNINQATMKIDYIEKNLKVVYEIKYKEIQDIFLLSVYNELLFYYSCINISKIDADKYYRLLSRFKKNELKAAEVNYYKIKNDLETYNLKKEEASKCYKSLENINAYMDYDIYCFKNF